MAMINCKECKNPVSSTAPTCPNCGAPVKKPARKAGCGTVLLLLLIIVAWISTFSTTEYRAFKKQASATSVKPTIPTSTPPPTPPSAEALWNTTTDQSPINDATNVYLSRQSNNTITNRYGQAYRPTLSIRCKENTTSTLIAWDEFLSTNDTPVITRIDKKPAITEIWGVSTDYKAIGKWTGSSAIPFVKQLTNANELFVQVTPHGESPRSAVFDLSDLSEALKPLRKACNW